ncbi:MAG TPA: hypothetical protein VNP95_07800 [Thermomicrobiales bacterium]|jgi:hypothetical protein|nr:hypothetical protein [Thermomicrobiales bacterium]
MSTPAPARNTRDSIRGATPMHCPICNRELTNVIIRDLGGVTASIIWQLHAGECPEHGWFQTEFVSRPPREIFAVTRPFGAARRVVVNGREYYSFSTAWNDLTAEEKRKPVNPLDGRYWATRPVSLEKATA